MAAALRAMIFLVSLASAAAFMAPATTLRATAWTRGEDSLTMHASSGDDFGLAEAAVQSRIKEMVIENNVLLFMKGNRMFPQCGFSNTAVQILTASGTNTNLVRILVTGSSPQSQ